MLGKSLVFASESQQVHIEQRVLLGQLDEARLGGPLGKPALQLAHQLLQLLRLPL